MDSSTLRTMTVLLLCFSGHGLDVKTQDIKDTKEEMTSAAPMIVKLDLDVAVNSKNQNKNFYSTVLSVGGPQPQEFRMGFDLGGGTTMLPTKDCKAKACAHKKLYDKWASNMAEDIKRDGTRVVQFKAKISLRQSNFLARDVEHLVFESIELGDGRAHGNMVRDKFCIKNKCFPFDFLAAYDMDDKPFIDEPLDGIVGLGPGALVDAGDEGTGKGFDFLYSLTHAMPGHSQMIFGLYLGTGNGGELAFGGYDQKRLDSPISWAPIADVNDGRWQVQISAIHVGNSTADVCAGSRCLAVMDFGTSLLGVPAELEDPLERQISAGLQNCEKPNFPDLQIELNGITLTVPVDDYAPSRAVHVNDPCKPDLETHGIDKWLKPGTHMFLLGESVLRRYYTIFDKESNRIGFSQPKELPMDNVKEAKQLEQDKGDIVLLVQVKVTVTAA